jgi:hypothetical protein
MIYYKFEYGCDNKEVGSQYPQVWDFIKGYSPENEDNGVYSLYYAYNPLFPPIDPDLSGFKLAGGAKYTDFLSNGFGNRLFLLSENAKRFMEDLNLDVHRFYKGKVTSLRKKTVEDYYVMKLVSENWQYLDFPNCDFFIKHVNTGDIIPAKFKSPEEFIKKSGELLASEEDCYSIYSSHIKMTDAFHQKNLDLFMIDECNYDWYVSERFVEEYNKRKFTGLEFEPVDI